MMPGVDHLIILTKRRAVLDEMTRDTEDCGPDRVVATRGRVCVCGTPLLSWEPPYCSTGGSVWRPSPHGRSILHGYPGDWVEGPDCRAVVARQHVLRGAA